MTDEAAVFLSYAHRSSLDHARALEGALEAAGIRTFRDETEIADGDPFPEAIIDALLGSQVIVVFSDPVYFERDYCRWELEAALAPAPRDAAEVRSVSLDRVVVARPADRQVPDLLDRFPPALAIRQWPRASETDRLVLLVHSQLATHGPTLEARLGSTAAAELRARLLEGSRVPPPTLPRSVPRFPAVLPPSLRDAFVGRSETLWLIDYLLRSRYGTPETNQPTVAIEGGGGTGKTRLALEYVHRYGHHYPGGLFWVEADTTPERREEQLHGILRALRPTTPDLVELRKHDVDGAARLGEALSDIPTDTPALYVVDNPPEPEPGTQPEPITQWCPAPGNVALLLASRLRVSIAEGVDPLVLPELPPAAAVAVLAEKHDRSALPDNGWTTIADWVGRLPLALVLLNRALRLSSLSASRLRDLAQAGAGRTAALDRQMEALRGQVPTGSLRGITEAFALSYSLLSPEAQHLGRLIAYLAPDPVPEALLDALGNGLASSAARAALVARSFGTPGHGAAVPVFGRMHRVLADFLRTQSMDPEAELGELLSPLLAVLDFSALEDPDSWPVVNTTVPHASLLALELEQLGGADNTTVVAGSELRARIAITLHAQGDLAGARAIQDEVLVVRRRILGPEHPATLDAAGNLAITLRAQGDLAGARALAAEVLTASRRILGPEHADTLSAANNLAMTLHAQGDLAGARALEDEVLAACRRILGPEHPKTLSAAHNLAMTLHAQGDRDGARALEDQVLAVRRRIFGPEHPKTLSAANNLALMLHAQGDFAGARAIQDEVLAVRRRIFGPEHPATLSAANNLANTLHAQGDLAGARALQDEVLAARRRILGPEHPATLHAAGSLANTLHAQGDVAGARVLEDEVFAISRRILGPEHPDTLLSAGNLAITLRAQGDLAGARALEDQVLAARRRILGPEHPDTLTAANNLAATLHAQGDRAGAQALEDEVFATSRRILGSVHPDTLAGGQFLAQLTEDGPAGAEDE
jgi:tetratricopeptide (TPR) repeat protein